MFGVLLVVVLVRISHNTICFLAVSQFLLTFSVIDFMTATQMGVFVES